MVQVFKIIRDIDNIDKNKLFTVTLDSRTRGHQYKLFKRQSRLNIRKNVFSNRVVDTWNSLLANVVQAPSLNSFKSRLYRHWSDHPSESEPSCHVPHATGQSARWRQRSTNAPEEAGIA